MEQMMELKGKIINFALSKGFDLVKIAPAKLEQKHVVAFNEWLDKGYEADMAYMRKKELREDIKKILPKAKAVICLATNYYYENSSLKSGHGRVARYAYGRDYHKVISRKLKEVEIFIKELTPYAETKSYVDTGPVLERAYAEASGIGFFGKNSLIITKEFGSYVFLSEIITTLNLPSDQKILQKTNNSFAGCGGCKKCIDACPTGAIIAPGVIDSSKCISYLTIENKKGIPKKLAAIIKKARLLYGCDICQEVCPHNKRARITTHFEFKNPRLAGDQLPLKKIISFKTDTEFLATFAGSAVMRAKRKGLQRNAQTLFT